MPIVSQFRLIPAEKLSTKIIFFNGSLLEEFTDDRTTAGNQSTTSYRSNLSGAQRRAGVEESDSYSGEQLSREIGGEYRQRYDTGHEFSTLKRWSEDSWKGTSMSPGLSFRFRPSGFGGYCTFSGSCRIQPNVYSPFASISIPTSGQITMDGTSCINATIPTAPEAGLTQFLGELREGIPRLTGMIAQKKGLNPTSASEEYLNREFGVKPFINDLTKFVVSMVEANKIVRQYRRDSGRNVRRKTVLKEERRTSVVTQNSGELVYPYRVLGSYPIFSEPPVCSIVDSFYDKVWFSGAYTYHVAELDTLFSKLEGYEQLANHLLGTRITPDTIWELTPWSWLIDWFSNFGQIVQNVSWLSQDSTVLRYGYVMHETHAIRTRTVSGLRAVGTDAAVPSLYSVHSQVSKVRTRATPYGFGLNLGALSPRRWAILGALGMTKGSNSLRLSD